MGFVPADASRKPARSRSSARVARNLVTSVRASATSAQIFVPTSTSDWRNSGFTSSPRRGSASAISVSMWARSRPSASTIWYSSSTPRVSQSSFTREFLREELVSRVLVGIERPDLRDLVALEVEDVDRVLRQLLALALRRDRGERRAMAVVREDRVPLDLERPGRELDELPEEPEYLVMTPVLAGDLAATGNVEHDVVREELPECVQVALLEGVVPPIQQVDVLMRHAFPLPID